MIVNCDTTSKKLTADPTSHADCGNTCHMTVRAKDYIFHPYGKR